jgi:hypothetical protein
MLGWHTVDVAVDDGLAQVLQATDDTTRIIDALKAYLDKGRIKDEDAAVPILQYVRRADIESAHKHAYFFIQYHSSPQRHRTYIHTSLHSSIYPHT